MTPPTLDGCGGQYIKVRGCTAPICIGCPRYGRQTTLMIQPRAALNPATRVWECPDKPSQAFMGPAEGAAA